MPGSKHYAFRGARKRSSINDTNSIRSIVQSSISFVGLRIRGRLFSRHSLGLQGLGYADTHVVLDSFVDTALLCL